MNNHQINQNWKIRNAAFRNLISDSFVLKRVSLPAMRITLVIQLVTTVLFIAGLIQAGYTSTNWYEWRVVCFFELVLVLYGLFSPLRGLPVLVMTHLVATIFLLLVWSVISLLNFSWLGAGGVGSLLFILICTQLYTFIFEFFIL